MQDAGARGGFIWAGTQTHFILRKLPEPDKLGRDVFQIADIRCIGETIEKRSYFLALGKDGRWSLNRDHALFEAAFPGMLRAMKDRVKAAREERENITTSENIIVFQEHLKRRRRRPDQDPPPDGGEPMPGQVKRRACG